MLLEYLQKCFSGPVLPASVLLCFAMVYWLLALLTALDFDWLDLDLDVDGTPDADYTPFGLGLVALRFFNLGDVPVMIWGSVFVIAFWFTSMSFYELVDDPAAAGFGQLALLIARNAAIATVATKIITQPIKGRFEDKEAVTPEELIGNSCIVTTSEVTESFGQGEYQTDGAPLYLNIRCDENSLHKGNLAVIIDHDPESNTYWVKPATRSE